MKNQIMDERKRRYLKIPLCLEFSSIPFKRSIHKKNRAESGPVLLTRYFLFLSLYKILGASGARSRSKVGKPDPSSGRT